MRDAMAGWNQVRSLARVAAVAISALLCMLPCDEAMAQSTRTAMFLQGIPGPPNAVPGLPGWIPVDAYGAAASNFVSSGTTGGSSAGRAQLQSLEVSKRSDGSDVGLLEALTKGTLIASGCLLTYSTGGGGAAIPESAIGFGVALVQSLSTFAADGEPFQYQSVSIAPAQLSTIKYGANSGVFCWDAATNATCSGSALFACPGL
jgi:hypothetical protein